MSISKQFSVLALLTVLLLGLQSCKFLQVVETKNITNTPSIGLEWSLGEMVQPEFEKAVDSLVLLAMEEYNAEGHALKVHKKLAKEKDYLTLDVTRAKRVRAGGKVLGYALSAIGLALPVVMILGDAGAIIAFVYLPEHRMAGQTELSGSLAADSQYSGGIGVGTLAIFTRDSKKIPKMMRLFKEGLKRNFAIIEGNLTANSKAVK